MTTEEKFIVDLEGYLVIKNALSIDEVIKLNRIIDKGTGGGTPVCEAIRSKS